MACPVGEDVRFWPENGGEVATPAPALIVGSRRQDRSAATCEVVGPPGAGARLDDHRPGWRARNRPKSSGVVSRVRNWCTRVGRESLHATLLYRPRSTARIVSGFIASSSVGWGDHPTVHPRLPHALPPPPRPSHAPPRRRPHTPRPPGPPPPGP